MSHASRGDVHARLGPHRVAVAPLAWATTGIGVEAAAPVLWLVPAPGHASGVRDAAGTPDTSPDISSLDAEERRRAAALRRPTDRALYVAAHTVLRQLLGARIDLPPRAVRLTRLPCPGCGGPHGRPAIAGPAGQRVHFSLSHSGALALIALADRPVGVDIEEVPAPDVATDAAQGLHPTEQAELAALAASDPDAHPTAFARCWTRKEACLKATGEGITGDGLRGLLLGTGPAPLVPDGWTVTDVPVPAGYAAACALPESAATSPSASSVRQHR